MTRRILAAMAVTALACSPALGGDEKDKGPTLSIGDDAPAIEISHWLKGDEITEFEDDKVYVIEFWATWCGPCVASMPHMSELQEKYKDYDVTFVGISDEPLQTVVKFLFTTYRRDNKLQNDRTRYTLTADPDRSVMNAYHKAAGQTGIPSAFIVGKDQKIEWMGHPMAIDDALEAVVKDTWDRDEFMVQMAREREAAAKAEKIQMAMRTAYQEGDWNTVIAKMDELIALGDQYAGLRGQKSLVLAQQIGDYDKAYAFAAETVEVMWDNAFMLNQISWTIVDEKGLERRDFKLALKAAERASELTEGKDGAILDTLARVHYETGDLDKALMYQRRAVKHAEGRMLEDLQKTLDKYEDEAR